MEVCGPVWLINSYSLKAVSLLPKLDHIWFKNKFFSHLISDYLNY